MDYAVLDARPRYVRTEWVAFLAHVRGEGPSPVPAEYGRLMAATVPAGVESSETGQVVPVS